MQVKVIERTFKVVGASEPAAQFTFITSGTLHIWFPEIGLQMEAHRNQLRIEECTIIYTNGLHYDQRRAFWSVTLSAEDIEEFKQIMSDLNKSSHRAKLPERRRKVAA
ncbi:MAG: hypothetical protein ACRDA8_11615 [Shewanella sp.]